MISDKKVKLKSVKRTEEGLQVEEKEKPWSPGMSYVPKEGTAWNPLDQFPPNEPCYCGSGRKFKKCHRPSLKPCLPIEDVRKLEPYLPAIRAGKFRVINSKKGAENEATTSIDHPIPEPAANSPERSRVGEEAHDGIIGAPVVTDPDQLADLIKSQPCPESDTDGKPLPTDHIPHTNS